MDNPVGKLINCDSNSELPFSLAPSEIHIEESFDLRVEPCLARAEPIVSFHGGAARTLTTLLYFDRDADEHLDLKKTLTFLKELSKVNEATGSIPQIQFKMGTLQFKGLPQRIGTTFSRFALSGEGQQIRLDLVLISTEESTHGPS